MDFVLLKQKLNDKHVKATSQRLVIYAALLGLHEHPSAEQVHEKIRTQNPSISLGTVYKTLDTLVEAGLAIKVKTGDDKLRFDGKTEHHSHLHCIKTNKILDYEDDELQSLLEEYFRKKKIDNFRITDFQVQVNGELINE